MPKTRVFPLAQVTPGPVLIPWITFALDLRFPKSGILGRKILALVVRPQVNLLKHLAGAIPTFS
jgi:hypothetical protein